MCNKVKIKMFSFEYCKFYIFLRASKMAGYESAIRFSFVREVRRKNRIGFETRGE